MEGSRGRQAGRKHQCHRCIEGVREERFEQLSQEAKTLVGGIGGLTHGKVDNPHP